MNEEQTRRLLADLNEMPVRPSSDFVADLRRTIANQSLSAVILDRQNRRSKMLDESSHDVETISRSRRGLALVGGVIAAGIVGVLGLRALDEWGSPGPATEQDVTSTPVVLVEELGEDPEAVAAFAIVEAAFAAHRIGDADAWFDAISAGLRSMGEADLGLEKENVARRMVLGDQITSVECRPFGQGEWSEIAGSETATIGFRFRCEAERSDYFSEAAGTSAKETFEWVVAGDEIVGAASEEEDFSERREFLPAFRRWMGNNHPEDFSIVFTSPSEDQLPHILALLDEFIAQSGKYPVDR